MKQRGKKKKKKTENLNRGINLTKIKMPLNINRFQSATRQNQDMESWMEDRSYEAASFCRRDDSQ